jgi:2-polyprenyl-6-methoxyphenol hydroxylase-like FAD-dependent oxidoreductase
MSEDESRRYCEDVFKDDLGGHPLLTNRSTWLTFKAVTTRSWSCGTVVLIGDALRTVHFSIGSGTRMALEDAIALATAIAAHQDVGTALLAFERARRPVVEKILAVAEHSFIWYERMRERLQLDPLPFAYDYMMRSGRISHERLKERSPVFVAAYEACLASRDGPAPAGQALGGGGNGC